MRKRLLSGIIGCFLFILSPIVCTAASDDTFNFKYPAISDNTAKTSTKYIYTVNGWEFRNVVTLYENGRIQLDVFCEKSSSEPLDYYLTVYTGGNEKDANKYVVSVSNSWYAGTSGFSASKNSVFTAVPGQDRINIQNQGKQPDQSTVGDTISEFTVCLFMTKEALSKNHTVYYATAQENEIIKSVISFYDLDALSEVYVKPEQVKPRTFSIKAIMPTYDELLSRAEKMNTQLETVDSELQTYILHWSTEKEMEIQSLKMEIEELEKKLKECVYSSYDIDGNGYVTMADAVKLFRFLSEVEY